MKNQEAGLIKGILLVVIGLLILKFAFGFDVLNYVSGEEFGNFFSKVWHAVLTGWSYLIDMVLRLWGFITSLFRT